MPVTDKYFPFRLARQKARSLGLKGSIEYMALIKQRKKSLKGLPSNPHYVYRDSGWMSWGDFLGTGKISTAKVQFLPFYKARATARTLGISSPEKWRAFVQRHKIENLPLAPYKYYRDKGWISWQDWLTEQNQNGRKRNGLKKTVKPGKTVSQSN